VPTCSLFTTALASSYRTISSFQKYLTVASDEIHIEQHVRNGLSLIIGQIFGGIRYGI
jgi:hypothetical protein